MIFVFLRFSWKQFERIIQKKKIGNKWKNKFFWEKVEKKNFL